MRNLRLSDETTQSLEASWELDDPNVASYRVLYAGLSEDDTGESVSRSFYVLFISYHTPVKPAASSATVGIMILELTS